MNETRVLLAVDGMQIPGVFTAPQKPDAALLLIPGSFNSDVDGNYAPMFPGQPAIAPHAYKDLALQLGSHGIAVMRFAKTGPGTGAIVLDREESSKKYAQFSQRVRVAEAFLEELGRLMPGVPSFVAGHSEGAVVATLLVQSHSSIDGIVSLSGPAQPLFRMMLHQQFETDMRTGVTTPDSKGQYESALKMLEDFVASRPLPQGFEANPYARAFSFMIRPENAPYLRGLEAIDPAAEFGKLRLPALIVQGGRDSSVFQENAEMLHRAKGDSAVEIFPELQHFYKPVPAGLSPQDSFAVSSDSDPEVARAISWWISSVLRDAIKPSGML